MKTLRKSYVGARVEDLPLLLTMDEAAEVLRTTRAAVKKRVCCGLMPGVIRDGRRVLIRRDELLKAYGL